MQRSEEKSVAYALTTEWHSTVVGGGGGAGGARFGGWGIGGGRWDAGMPYLCCVRCKLWEDRPQLVGSSYSFCQTTIAVA